METIMRFKGLGNNILTVHSHLGAMGWQLEDEKEELPDSSCGVYSKGTTKAALFISYDDMVLRKI